LIYNVTSPANPGDYRPVLIWLVKVKPMPALTYQITLVQYFLHGKNIKITRDVCS